MSVTENYTGKIRFNHSHKDFTGTWVYMQELFWWIQISVMFIYKNLICLFVIIPHFTACITTSVTEFSAKPCMNIPYQSKF